MEKIESGGHLLVLVCRDNEWTDGLNFITPDSFFVQAGTWGYNKGKILAAHIHKEHPRTALKTYETVYVKQGKLKAFIYDNDRKFVKEIILSAGDYAVFAEGGHGYEILEDNTKVLEVKNGPFVSVEKDKDKF
ncbi:MAG: hypothetical protein HY063_00630 [Bacteroidetes bacterium]|nr:hypothetical protein [Bacteroidota bacterium]